MPLFTSSLDIPVYVSGHAQHILVKPQESKMIPDKLVSKALELGLSPADGDGDGKVGKTDAPDKVQALVKAMLELMAEGKKSNFTEAGEPKFAVLKKAVDFDFTKAEREAAWDLVSLKDAESQ